jgi:hypothetical protein
VDTHSDETTPEPINFTDQVFLFLAYNNSSTVKALSNSSFNLVWMVAFKIEAEYG